MKCWIPLITLFLTFQTQAQTFRIGLIDSGLNLLDTRLTAHICPRGHHDFTGEGLSDTNGHGTAMAGLIEQYAGKADYCLVIYKYYSVVSSGPVNLKHEVEALIQAGEDKVQIVNISSSGPDFSEDEYLAMKNNTAATFVVAAGNEGRDIDIQGNESYPACYYLENEIVVENVDESNQRASSSNYGKKIKTVEMGINVPVLAIGSGYSLMTGTSVSTAIHTGKLVRKVLSGN